MTETIELTEEQQQGKAYYDQIYTSLTTFGHNNLPRANLIIVSSHSILGLNLNDALRDSVSLVYSQIKSYYLLQPEYNDIEVVHDTNSDRDRLIFSRVDITEEL